MTHNSKLLSILSLLLVFVMLMSFSLTACNNGDDPDDVPSDGPSDDPSPDPDPEPDPEKPEYTVITIAEALELCGEVGNVTADRYYIRGTIDTLMSSEYGEMMVSDETGSIYVYGTYSSDGELKYYELDYQPVKGDEVLLHCVLQNYNGKKEVKNARLIEYKNNQGNIDVSDYTEASITEARAAEKGAKLKVDGIVARITYATGMKPNGFILVDEGASIYVYDGDTAQRVEIGNKIEIAGTKDLWILESEQAGAEKFGYKGSVQLTDVTLVSNDNKTDNAYDTSWITESTVKDIIETPVTENVTSLIYKVNALVKKVPGSGFVNYYFFDLDGETGTYTYTQCNGSDFAWLDEFDGKICTVYLTALNAKSTGTSCFFRFVPVSVYDESFKFDLTKTPDHVLNYYALGQFLESYTGNPELELMTEVSSELLGFENAEITYSSSNTAIITFTERDGKLIMECLDPGVATVTVTAAYNGVSKSSDVEIQVIDPAVLEASDVKSAIEAELNEIVTVKGIVGPSLVNRKGFYLIDETGVISIIVKEDSILGEVELGQEVVLKGKRDRFHNGKGDHAGQIAITETTVVANFYGNHEYDTSNFITDKTVADFYNLNVNENHSTEVYVLKATVVLEGDQHSTKIKLTDGTNYITLYSSSADQYEFLKAFEGEEITVEIAACNWNNKGYYAGCVLAVITEDGKVYNTLYFDAY